MFSSHFSLPFTQKGGGAAAPIRACGRRYNFNITTLALDFCQVFRSMLRRGVGRNVQHLALPPFSSHYAVPHTSIACHRWPRAAITASKLRITIRKKRSVVKRWDSSALLRRPKIDRWIGRRSVLLPLLVEKGNRALASKPELTHVIDRVCLVARSRPRRRRSSSSPPSSRRNLARGEASIETQQPHARPCPNASSLPSLPHVVPCPNASPPVVVAGRTSPRFPSVRS